MPYKNVLLLIADDWSPLAGCYGSPVIQTPSVDALAKRATRFRHAFCTTPSCAASRANILTGHYSHTHGQYGHSHGIHNSIRVSICRRFRRRYRMRGSRRGSSARMHVQPEAVYPWTHDMQQVEGGSRDVKE